MTDYSFTCTDAASTAELGKKLAQLLAVGDIVLLRGDLGAGKTTFARGLIQSICPMAIEVVSPTFTLVQTYESPKGPIYHYDLYRLKSNDDGALEELGWDDGLVNGITLVEWSERFADTMPQDALLIYLRQTPGSNERTVTLSGNENWQKRIRDGFKI